MSAREAPCPLYPRKQTCAVQRGMSAKGQKRTSANKLRSCPTCFSWTCWKPSNLQTMPGSPSLSYYMASMLGKCWWKIVTATAAMGGATDNPHDWEDAIAPPRQGRARAGVQGNLCHHWALSSAYFVAFTGRFIHGNKVSPGNLCREPAAVA